MAPSERRLWPWRRLRCARRQQVGELLQTNVPVDVGPPSEPAPLRRKPFIVGMAGALAPGSATELAAKAILAAAENAGAEIDLIDGPTIEAPIYSYGRTAQPANMQAMLDNIRRADGLVIASPAYHGCVSGLLKNALDYVEELSRDEHPYLCGRPVVCVAVAGGWQGANVTLQALRNIVHALRGWPTPLGLAINSQQVRLPVEGKGGDERTVADNRYAVCRHLGLIV